MPSERIPLGALLSVGQEQLAGASPVAVNAAADDTGTIRRRPGLQASTALYSSSFTEEIDGLHVTAGGEVYVTSQGAVAGNRELSYVGPLAGTRLGDLSGDLRSTFVDTEALLVVANGDAMVKVDLATKAVSPLGGSPPSASSHVAFAAARLLANDLALDRSKVRYSGPAAGTVTAGHETWSTTPISGFFSAESDPDPVVAIGTRVREVWVWGRETLEIYAPDALQVFSPLVTRNFGCSAPYSIVSYGNEYIWLDEHRRIQRSDGRVLQELSGPIGPLLKSFERVDDCWATRVVSGPGDWLVFTFPSEQQTLALQKGGGWCHWQAYEDGQFGPFAMSAHSHDPTRDRNFAGLTSGRVVELQDGVKDDLGVPIVAHVESGFQDRGTGKPKECNRIRVRVERGTAPVNAASPVAWLQWADRPGVWRNPVALYLGASGETRPVITLESLGVYRSRNWRFIFSADVDMALVGIEEDFELVEE